MTTQVVFAEVTESPLDAAALSAQVGHEAAGAVITFSGVVRNHDVGQAVDSIEYSSHPQAAAIIAQLARDAGRSLVEFAAQISPLGFGQVIDAALGLIVCGGCGIFRSEKSQMEIPWRQIACIGDDVILVSPGSC